MTEKIQHLLIAAIIAYIQDIYPEVEINYGYSLLYTIHNGKTQLTFDINTLEIIDYTCKFLNGWKWYSFQTEDQFFDGAQRVLKGHYG